MGKLKFPTASFLLRIPPHTSAARSKLKSAISGPSVLILIKHSRVDVYSQFRISVLILFIEEKARSHSAVLTGVSAPMLPSVDICGNMSRMD